MSIPYLSGHPFLPIVTSVLLGIVLCQSPIYRDTHFYFCSTSFIYILQQTCVNPLSIGTPISTGIIMGPVIATKTCQSPIYRDTHFYEQGEELWKMLKCVNPLSIGTPISTHSRASVAPVIPHLRVNPLSIGTPISTVRPKERWIATLTCVNPLSIGTPISTHSNSNRGGIGITVSIPYPSGHPFLQPAAVTRNNLTLTLVSIPYPSGHPFLLGVKNT